jgi:hypothetical protein
MASKHHSTREIRIKLLPHTHSLEVDYFLFIMVAMLVMLEKRPGTALAAFPPPIFTGFKIYFVVLCFSTGSPQKRLRKSLYRVFRSTPSILDQDGWHRSHDGQASASGAAWARAHTT